MACHTPLLRKKKERKKPGEMRIPSLGPIPFINVGLGMGLRLDNGDGVMAFPLVTLLF